MAHLASRDGSRREKRAGALMEQGSDPSKSPWLLPEPIRDGSLVVAVDGVLIPVRQLVVPEDLIDLSQPHLPRLASFSSLSVPPGRKKGRKLNLGLGSTAEALMLSARAYC